ncbi:MAG TPA: YihY family inner membrane protein [Dongiaceae bacterium]|jgi:membrane protein|nr:YihY family inner membrane protein [Dongiaceae bacterium]
MEGDGRDSGLQPASPTDEADRGRFGQFQHLLDKTRQHKAYSLIGYVVRRFNRDSCPSVASSLSYTSLLAMVPMMAIGLAMFAAFPAFSDMRDAMLRAMIENAAPSLAVMVEEHLQTFIRNAGETTGVGILGLAITALLLINTIQTAFDRIWGGGRGFKIQRFPVYWALITLGPILFGIAFSISSYAFAIAQSSGYSTVSAAVRFYAAIAPFILEAVGFLLFYRLIPTRPVRWADAATGAFIAALLFELLKRAFGIYLGFLGSYQTLYGALAALPIFLIWMYAGWLVVLIGAEITASLPEWRSGRRDPDERPRRGDMLGLALGALSSLRAIQGSSAGGEKVDALSRQLGAEIGKLTHVMDVLRGARFVVRSDNNRWVLARDLNEVTLNDLVSALNLSLADVQDCPKQTMSVMSDLAAGERGLLDRSIEDTLKSHGLR